MAKFYVTNTKTVGNKIKTVVGLIAAGAAIWASIPGINYVRNKLDNRSAYNDVAEFIEENHYSQASTTLQGVKERLTQEQISKLEQKIAEIHPDKLLANTQNMDPAEKLGVLRSLNQEYQVLGVDKPELKIEYLTASLVNLRKQFSANQTSYAINCLNDLLKDDFIFVQTEQGITSSVEISPEFYDELLNTVTGNIRKFESPSKESIDPIIDLMIQLTGQLIPSAKQKCISQLMEAYGDQVNAVLTADKYLWETEIRMLGSLRKTEKKHEYKIKIIDVEQTILDKIEE